MANNDAPKTLRDYFSVLRRRWLFLALIIPTAVLISVFIAFTTPAKFLSSATIMIEPSSIAPELVQTTVINYADHQIDIVRRRVMSSENLAGLVSRVDPYPDRKDLSVEEKSGMIAGDMQIEKVDLLTLKPATDESNVFSVHYLNPNPRIAAAVAKELANLFLEYNQKSRTQSATDTYRFMQEKSEELNQQILAIEEKVAEFKRLHGDALPEQRARNQQDLQIRQRESDMFSTQIRLDEQRESLLALQLEAISPTLVGAVSDWRTQLATLRAQLGDARSRYTPEHPAIKRLERSIKELTASHPTQGLDERPDNPEYLQVKSQLDSVRQDKAALQSNLNRVTADMNDLQRRLAQSPGVEQEYVQLERTYQTAQGQFGEIQGKLREADIARSLESEQRGEKFTLIRSPAPARLPATPNRVGIILLGIVLGAGISIIGAAIVDGSDPSVRSQSDLAELTSLVPMGAVPVLLNSKDRRRRLVLFGCAGLIFAAATVAAAIVVLETTASEQRVLSAQAG